jgi:hypothetical protein
MPVGRSQESWISVAREMLMEMQLCNVEFIDYIWDGRRVSARWHLVPGWNGELGKPVPWPTRRR